MKASPRLSSIYANIDANILLSRLNMIGEYGWENCGNCRLVAVCFADWQDIVPKSIFTALPDSKSTNYGHVIPYHHRLQLHWIHS